MRELAALFLRLGTTAFGGPAAHIAMMEDEVVRRREWMTRQQFLDLLGATNLIPGPNSTEMAIHVGYLRAGWKGLLVAGASFIVPAALIVLALAWAYVRYRSVPALEGILYGVKPVVIAVVLQALVGLGRTALETRTLVAVAVAGLVATALGVNELIVLLVAGLFMVSASLASRSTASILALPLIAVPVAADTATVESLFLFFLKVGSVLYGSGYVLLAFLRSDLVEQNQWLTEAELLDAVAVSQVTPGPVFTVATFIGYLLGGVGGAAAGTIGIFLPAFLFVAASGPLIPKIRQSRLAGAFLDGVIAASLALMAWVSFLLARGSFVDLWTVLIGVGSAVALLRFRVNSTWLILAGAGVGLLRSL